MAVDDGGGAQHTRGWAIHRRPHQPLRGVRSPLLTRRTAQPNRQPATVPTQLEEPVDGILLPHAHRCRRRGRRPVSDVIRQLFDGLQGPTLRGVSGAAWNLPLLRQHLQLLAEKRRGERRLLVLQLGQHDDGQLRAEGEHREVQRLHDDGREGVRREATTSSCSRREEDQHLLLPHEGARRRFVSFFMRGDASPPSS